jgi:hypothetical protein
VPNLQQRPDGTWGPASSEPWHPGVDVERTADGSWTVYRTTERGSVELAHGRGRVRLLLAWWTARLYWQPHPRGRSWPA